MMENLRLSLSDLLGADYTRAVCEARALLTGESRRRCAPWPTRGSTGTPKPSPAGRRR